MDAAIAGIVQSKEPLADPDGDKGDTHTINTPQNADPEDDIPLATLAKTLEKPKTPAKGILKTKTYGRNQIASRLLSALHVTRGSLLFSV